VQPALKPNLTNADSLSCRRPLEELIRIVQYKAKLKLELKILHQQHTEELRESHYL